MKIVGKIDDLTLYRDAMEAVSIMTVAVRKAQKVNWEKGLSNVYYDQARGKLYYVYPDGKVVWEDE